MGSLEGNYFLTRGLFLPDDLPALMGTEEAREGLARLGGSPPGMAKSQGIGGPRGVCMLDSTLYLRNQLLRDSDWASMQHSLELRTPLVDAALLNTLSPYLNSFNDGAGKKLLASAPMNQLPPDVVNRPKSGFGLPMGDWLNMAADHRKWSGTPLLASPRTPWARRWARMVMSAA